MYASQYGPTKGNLRKRFQAAMSGPEVCRSVSQSPTLDT